MEILNKILYISNKKKYLTEIFIYIFHKYYSKYLGYFLNNNSSKALYKIYIKYLYNIFQK